MSLRRLLSAPLALLLVLLAALTVADFTAGPAAGAPAPISLTLPSSTAFSMLGRSCGGIQEQAFATGFGADGNPIGAVYLQTRCGGSGRGGGYHVTTYSAWASAEWDFAGALVSSARLSAAPSVSATFAATDARGDTVSNVLSAVNVSPASCAVGNTTYCTYRAYLTVPLPGAPTAVTVSQVGDALLVAWTASATGGRPSSSTVAATPSGGGTSLSAIAAGSTTSVSVTGVAPSTTYSIVVTSTNAGGTSAASAPVSITTHAASTVPGVPNGVSAVWSSNGSSILVHWTAPSPGDSPIDDYQVSIAQYDPNGPPTVVDAGVATSVTVNGFSNVPDWAVLVRAHNGAGWGPWSSRVVLGGL